MLNSPVVDYFRENTGVEIPDIFKFLFQSCFGCEHLVSDYETALKRIEDEMQNAAADDLPGIEQLDGDYCRVHLKMIKDGQTAQKLCRIFILSSAAVPDAKARLETELEKLISYCDGNGLPFSKKEMAQKTEEWRKDGFPPVHHSENFRAIHRPAYRVIKKEYLSAIFE